MPQKPTNPTDKVVVTRAMAEYFGADHLLTCKTMEVESCTCGFAETFYPTAKEKGIERRLAKTVRELVRAVDRVDLLPGVLDGIRVYNHLFDTTRAAEKISLPFKGLTIEPTTISSTTKRGHRAIMVATLINKVIEATIPRFEIVVNPMIPLSEIKKRRFKLTAKDLANERKRVPLK
jgi:hypothetical protein